MFNRSMTALSPLWRAILAGFCPADRDRLMAEAQEGANSRLWAGIHYESDYETGLVAGQMAFEQAMSMMHP